MTLMLNEDQMDVLVALLNESEPVGMPTETVYGLAASIFDPIAIQKIFTMKGRPQDNPLIAHVSSISMVNQIAEDLPTSFHVLAAAFWPGALTMVLPRKAEVPSIVCAGGPTVAVRMPSHPLALKLIERVNAPLVAPSANISGSPSPTTAEHVLSDFDGTLSAILDGGACEIGIESTVISLISEVPVILRPGSITKESIESVLGYEIALPRLGEPLLSPGMKYKHYAPKAKIHIVTVLPDLPADSFILSQDPMHRTLDQHTFYAQLRLADKLVIEDIWILLDSRTLHDVALMNRLNKAAGICL
jgi:L-threonylcarbamoyladenylate synthase